MRELDPDVVGLSVMTFQRRTALQAHPPHPRHQARRARSSSAATTRASRRRPTRRRTPASTSSCAAKGDLTFRELLRALERGDARAVGVDPRPLDPRRPALPSQPAAPVSGLDDGTIALPNRGARVLDGYTFLGRPVDIVETSRGCTYDCSFCSIIEMRGRNFHTFGFERVLADIADARARGARAIFIVDDNITLNVARFEALCRAIVDAGLDDIHYIVQAMTSSIANHGETLAPLMRAAGFRYVFLGIENVLDEDLAFLRASAKNARREGGRRIRQRDAARDRAAAPRRHVRRRRHHRRQSRTTRASRSRPTSRSRGSYVDWPYIQHPTPYPGTPMTKDFRERDLIVNERVEEYDGTTAVVRTEHLHGGRDRVHALARRAVDEGAARAGGDPALSRVRDAPRAADARAHVPRQHVAVGARPRGLARGVRALQGDPARRTRVSAFS